MRITDLRLIAVVDHTIAIDIDKFQVTRGYRGALQGVRGIPTAILVKIGLYIRLILHHAIGLIAPEVTDRMSFFHTGHIGGSLGQKSVTSIYVMSTVINFCYLILVMREVQADAIAKV